MGNIPSLFKPQASKQSFHKLLKSPKPLVFEIPADPRSTTLFRHTELYLKQASKQASHNVHLNSTHVGNVPETDTLTTTPPTQQKWPPVAVVATTQLAAETNEQRAAAAPELNNNLCLGMFEEDPRTYCPGGFHPVHIGELYSHGRYEVMYKLGFGCFSTVWLVHDHQTSTNLSMKIITANLSKTTKELEVLKAVTGHNPQHPGQKHVLQLLDSFFHDGPNGKHLCIITEILGPKAFDHELRQWQGMECGVAREISALLLLAVDYVHEAGVVHGDIYPNNFVLRLSGDVAKMSMQELTELLGEPEVFETYRDDDEPLRPGDPRHAVQTINLIDFVPVETGGWDSVLIDFGSCE